MLYSNVLHGNRGVLISKVQWLPFSFDIVLAIMPFMWFGDKLKSFDIANIKNVVGVVAAFIWAILLFTTYKYTHTYTELSIRSYPLGPISYITAMSGSLMIFQISKMITGISGPHQAGLTWLGRRSMYLYLIHKIDVEFPYLWNVSDNLVIVSITRITLDLIVCIVVSWIMKQLRLGASKDKRTLG